MAWIDCLYCGEKLESASHKCLEGKIAQLESENTRLKELAYYEDGSGKGYGYKDMCNQLESSLAEARTDYHLAHAKISSREAIIKQLSETELAKDVTKLEVELAEAREEKEVQENETAGEYVARRIMDIFQEVAEHVGNGLFELDHPAPIIRGSIAMTNAWNAYLNETLNLPTNG